MPSFFRTPKTLSSWLELDYFRRRRLFRGWWGGSLLLALIVSLITLGVMLAATGHRAYQAGPLSHPHAMFNDRCELCHQNHGTTFTRLWRGDSVGSIPDDACKQCHAGSHHNPPHAAMGTCVSCHTEHRGHAALVRIEDRACVVCHRDLKRQDGSQADYASKVISFDDKGGHPAFRTPKDEGTIKFNHKVHLQAHKIDPVSGRPPEAYEKLDCVNCHTMDAEGRYSNPIVYDTHCKRCHPLAVQMVGDWKGDDLSKLARDFAREPLPHPKPGQNADSVRAALRERLTRFIQSPKHEAFLKPSPPPDKRIPLPALDAPREDKEYAWVHHQLAQSERELFQGAGGCRYCHTVVGQVSGLPTLAKPAIRSRWWTHATFNHNSHRMLNCEQCHKVRDSALTSDVNLPTIELCLCCHNKNASASARADCVECHVYHDPKLQRQAREKGTKTIDLLLNSRSTSDTGEPSRARRKRLWEDHLLRAWLGQTTYFVRGSVERCNSCPQ
jgi:hypothetical protein